MTAERWAEIKAVFEQADAAPLSERPLILDRLCGHDPDLRREVEALLAAEDSPTFIQSAIAQQAASQAASPLHAEERFGHYQLVRRVGQGGMGAVYEAQRVDDFHKKVALKIIRHEFDSDFARTRFQQERQLLATLEHPYIARLLDGGESNDGAPYLVLEFVDGIPLNEYNAMLDRAARLRLFLKVCEAVEHAHRNLVIHRDLKPANILVTPAGNPKLLDFGIAKLLDSSATQTAFTALTPDYASPEQVRNLPISTASDVYSLGVILYQLLTDRRPYTLSASTAFEMDRVICEQPPEPPGLGDELDYIILMALRKEPERRYSSVQRLADDIERYLDHRPVSAQPDTSFYRARKYFRRHWIWLAAASIALTAICAGAGVAVYQARQARRQFNQVRQLANHFLFDFDDAIANTPGTVKAREMVVATAQDYLGRLNADAGSDPGLQWELAVAYGKVAAAQGSTTLPSLRRPQDAIASFEKGIRLARSLDDRKLLDTSQRNTLLNMLCDLELTYRSLKQYDNAGRVGREAIARSGGLDAISRGRAAGELGITLSLRGDLAGSEKALEQLLAVSRENAQHDPSFANRLRAATSLSNLGSTQLALTEFDRAQASVTAALALIRQLVAERPNDPRVARFLWLALSKLGDIAGAGDFPSQGNAALAAARYQEALQFLNPQVAADPNDRASRATAGLEHVRAAYALRDADPQAALPHARQAATLLDEGTPDNTEFRAQPRIAAADANRALHRFPEAERLLREADGILKKRNTDTEADLQLARARLESARGNPQAAASSFERSIALCERLYTVAKTPANAWALTRNLEFAAAALPDTARPRRERVVQVWTDQTRLFPGHGYLEKQLATATAAAK